MEQRRGSIAKQVLLVDNAKSTSVSRRSSVVNSTTVARRNSVILSDDSKALRECEDKLKYANDMLTAIEQTNLKLRQEFDLLAGKFNDVKNCAIDLGWRYCPTFSPDFVFIPKLDPDLVESESKAGKYLLRETLGRGQFSVVKACQTQALTLINGQKPSENNLLSPIVPTSEEKDTEVNNGNGNGNGNGNLDMQKKKSSTKSACKIISKDNIYSIFSILRLEQELKALNALQNHKNIVEYRDCLHGNKFLYIITEYVPTDLFEFLETNHDKLNENIAGVIMRELVDGVTFMASKGIVHRDLKPENILISLSRNDIKVKICDFGLCSFLENGNSVLSDFRGSPGFFAPEVLLQKSFCSLKAETFSLGCIGLEMLVPQKFFAEVWMTPYINNMKLLDGNLFNRSIRDAVIESNSFIKSKYNTAVSEFIHQTLNIVPQNRKHAMDLRSFDWITHTNKLLAADILNSREPRSFHLRGTAHHANQSSANGPASNSNASNVASSTVGSSVGSSVAASGADLSPPGIGVLSKPLTDFVDRVPSPGVKASSSLQGAKETISSSTAYNNCRSVPEITDLSPMRKGPPSTTSLPTPSAYSQPSSSQFLDAYSPSYKNSPSTSDSASLRLRPNTPATSHSAIPDIMTAILNAHNPQSSSSFSSAESPTTAGAGSILPAIKLQRRGSVHGNRVGYNSNVDKGRDIAREIGGGGGGGGHLYSSKSGPIGLGMGSMGSMGMGGGPVPTLAYGRAGTQLDINPFSPANEQRDRDWRAYAALKSLPHNSHTSTSSALPLSNSSQYNNSYSHNNNQYAYNPPGLYNFKEISYDYSIDKFNMQSLINNLDKASSGYKTLTVKNLQDNQKLFIQSAEGRGFDPASLSSVHIGQTF